MTTTYFSAGSTGGNVIRERCGIVALNFSIVTKTTLTAGTSYAAATLNSKFSTLQPQNVAGPYGHGFLISGTSISFIPITNIPNNYTIWVRFSYIADAV